MTIRAMAVKYGIPVDNAATSASGSALVFVINRDFLPGLKVLLYSMAKQQTLLDLPVLLISEDGEVLADEFVTAIGDEFRHVSDEDIAAYSGISNAAVPERIRLDWIPKYTFLKWMIYDDYGYDRLIWIDADILCLRPVEDLATMSGHDLFASPTFPRKLLHENNSAGSAPLSDLAATKRVRRFLEGGYASQKSLNSGVMVVGKGLLNRSFRDSLISWAEQHEVSTEQRVLRSVIDESENVSRGMLDPSFNFSHSYLARLDQEQDHGLKQGIRLLHYVGARSKPWDKSGSMLEVESYRLWHDHLAEASSFDDVFSLPPAGR